MSILKLCKKFLSNEDGMETVEYAVMGALITLAAVTAIGLLSGKVSSAFTNLANKLP